MRLALKMRAGLCALALAYSCVIVAAQSDSPDAALVQQTINRLTRWPTDEKLLSEARNLGFVLLRQGRFMEASKLFPLLAQATPRDYLAWYGAALAALNLRQLDDAERFVRQAQELATIAAKTAPDAKHAVVDAAVLRALIVAVKGDNNAALQLLREAVVLQPEHFDAQFALGRAYYGAGDALNAAQAFRRALALQPDSPKARFFLATALERAGDEAGALEEYRILATRQPNLVEGHLGLGVLLVKSGAGLAEGIKELSRAVALNGDSYEARVVLGRALLQDNRPAEAVAHLQKAVELAAGNPEPHFQLAQAYRRLGRKDEAAAQFAIVRQIHAARRQPNAPD